MRFKSGGTFQSTCLIGQTVFKKEHSKLYILNAQPIIKAFQRQISHLQQKEGFPCVVDLSLMTSKHDNPQALNHCPIPKSATRTVSYNLRSGSERTINKFKKNYKRANNFLHLDILKLDYLLYTPSIVMLYFLACIHIYHLFIQYLFNCKKVK